MGEADPILLTVLKTQSFIPLSVLLKVAHSSPYYNEQNKTSIFYAESWALTHYLMIGDRMAHKPMLISFLKALDYGKTQEEAATEAFGDLTKLQSELTRYVNQTSFFSTIEPRLKTEENQFAYPRPSSDRHQRLYHGLTYFPTPIFMERDAPKAHEAC